MILLSYACGILALTALSTPDATEFFTFPGWCPSSLTADKTFGSCASSNITHRITADTIANVYATFDAFCERAYYYSCGERNQWDTSEYGSTQTAAFRFALPTNAAPPFVYDPDANREVVTRRFVEYANLTNVAHNLELAGNLDSLFAVTRPSWTNVSDRYWSSSGFDAFGGHPFPSFGWTDDEPKDILAADGWNLVCPSFDFCRRDRVADIISWGYVRRPSATSLAYEAWQSCNFGEPPFNDPVAATNQVPHSASYTNTASETVGMMYGGLYITNEVPCCVSNAVNMIDEGDEVDSIIRMLCFTRYSGGGITNLYAVAGYNGISSIEQTASGYDVTAELMIGVADDISSSYLPATIPILQGIQSPAAPESECIHIAPVSPSVRVSISWDPSTSTLTYGTNVTHQGEEYPYHFFDAWYEWKAIATNNTLAALREPTRRLWPEQLAAVNRCLGALDRVYAKIDTEVTNVVKRYSRFMPLEAPPFVVGLDWGIRRTSGLEGTISGWTSGDVSNTVEEIGRETTVGVHTRSVRPTSSWVSGITLIHSSTSASVGITKDNIESFAAALLPEGEQTITLDWSSAWMTEPTGNEVWGFIDVTGGTLTLGPFYMPASVTLYPSATYTRSYSCRSALAPARVLDRFPHQLTSDMIRSGSVWTMVAQSAVLGTRVNPVSVRDTPYYWSMTPRPEVRHRTYNSTFTSSPQCRNVISNQFASVMSDESSKFCQLFGAGVDQYEQIIPMNARDVTDHLSHIEFEEAELSASFTLNTDSNRVSRMNLTLTRDEHGRVNIEWNSFVLENGETVDPGWPVSVGSVDFSMSGASTPDPAHPITPVESYGANVSTRYKTYTATEFNWKALRATKQ